MLRATLASLLTLMMLCSVLAQQFYVVGSMTPNTWYLQQVGAGGLIAGVDIATSATSFPSNASNTSRCIRTDTNGAFCWDYNKSQWCQMVTANSMPAGYFGYTGTGASQANNAFFVPIFEIAAAPSNPSVGYIVMGGALLKSTNFNAGCDNQFGTKATFTVTNLTGLTITQLANVGWFSAARFNGRFMAVDPNNSNVVYIGTPPTGAIVGALTKTEDGGVTSNTIAGLPTVGNPAINIAIDPTSTTTCPFAGSGTCSKNVYAAVNTGTDAGDVWQATDGGQTFTNVSTGHFSTGVHSMAVDPGNGTVWLVDHNNATGNVWKFASSTWTESIASAIYHSLAIDQRNNGSSIQNMVIVQDGNCTLNPSSNGGSTFSGSQTYTRANGDTPWLATQINMGAHYAYFDPVTANKILVSCGQGVYSASMPSGTFTYTPEAVGVEQLVTTQVTSCTANKWFGGDLDESMVQLDPRTRGAQATSSTVSPLAGAITLTNTQGIDCASSNTSFIAAITSGTSGGDQSGSFTGNLTGYQNFSTFWVGVPGSQLTDNGSGGTRVDLTGTGVTTANLTTWSAGSGSIVTTYCIGKPVLTFYGLGSGTILGNNSLTSTWEVTKIDATHFDIPTAWFSSYQTCPTQVFTVLTPPLSAYNGSNDIVGAASSGGKIQLTLRANAGAIANGAPIVVSGVTGTTEANGNWIASSVSGVNVTLQDSTFTNAFTGGGKLSVYDQAGGSIAASTPSNITVAHQANSFPACTTDGGHTWAILQPAAVPPTASTAFTIGSATNGQTFTLTATDSRLTGSPITISYTASGDTTATVVTHLLANVTANGTLNAAGITGFGASPENANQGIVGQTGPIYPVWTVGGTGTITLNTAGWKTGWGNGTFNNAQIVVADRITANKFYEYNYDYGLFSHTNCATPTQVNTGSNSGADSEGNNWAALSGVAPRMKSVWNETGHLLFSAGTQGAVTNSTTGLWRSCNGGTNFRRMPGVFTPTGIGVGAPKAGKSYQTLYFIGWYSADDQRSSLTPGTFGVWQSNNDPNHGNSGICDVGADITSGKVDNNGGGTNGNTLTVTTLATANSNWNIQVGDAVIFDGGGTLVGRTVTGDHTHGDTNCDGSTCTGTGTTGTYKLSGTATTVSAEAIVLSPNTWTQLGGSYPINWQGLGDVTGDQAVYGNVYLGAGPGNSWRTGYFPN